MQSIVQPTSIFGSSSTRRLVQPVTTNHRSAQRKAATLESCEATTGFTGFTFEVTTGFKSGNDCSFTRGIPSSCGTGCVYTEAGKLVYPKSEACVLDNVRGCINQGTVFREINPYSRDNGMQLGEKAYPFLIPKNGGKPLAKFPPTPDHRPGQYAPLSRKPLLSLDSCSPFSKVLSRLYFDTPR